MKDFHQFKVWEIAHAFGLPVSSNLCLKKAGS